MHSEAYRKARKEFINCIVLSPIGLFIPLFLAFTEWLPVMRAEKKKELGNVSSLSAKNVA